MMSERENGPHAVIVRELRERDIQEISFLYFNTVRKINAHDYDPKQIEAWAPKVEPVSYWRRRFAKYSVFVAEISGAVAGFAEFDVSGHVDCFYVHHEKLRMGVGSALMRRIEHEAAGHGMRSLFADVSVTARPFFEKMGFEVADERDRKYRGQVFRQYFMEKALGAERKSGKEP